MDRTFARRLVLTLAVACLAPACKRSESTPIAPPSGAAPAMPPPAGGAPVDSLQRIAAAEAVVAQDPRNALAWIQLGNDYFDTHQHRKAIDAYGRALELQPDNPDVITDQGVMYRDVGEFEKARANFERANRIDPKHMQSLFNLGVVYAYDLKEPAKAIEAWKRIVQTSPASPQAQQARQAIDELDRKTAAGGK